MGVDDGYRRIGVDPFATPADTVRRLRGHLVAPVTVWTAYGLGDAPAGITVSSVLVAEGEPPSVLGLVGPVSEFWDALGVSKRFVVHVLAADQVRVADQFAMRYPGEPFDGMSVSYSEWGPVLDDMAVRASCWLAGWMEAGYQILARGSLAGIHVPDDPSPPLAHYRGRYFTVGPRRSDPPGESSGS